MSNYHILNGDCLAQNFPKELEENSIVWRECLVDGPLSEENFFENRERFISEGYGILEADYYNKVLVEFQKLKAIPDGSKVYFWFGHDLFCQVNFWFLVDALKDRDLELFRVFPKGEYFDFEYFKSDYFNDFIDNSAVINRFEMEQISKLWKQYQLSQSFEVFPSEVIRHFQELARANDQRFNGELEKELKELKSQTSDFPSFFEVFQKQFPIYGFGDLQVKNLWQKL